MLRRYLFCSRLCCLQSDARNMLSREQTPCSAGMRTVRADLSAIHDQHVQQICNRDSKQRLEASRRQCHPRCELLATCFAGGWHAGFPMFLSLVHSFLPPIHSFARRAGNSHAFASCVMGQGGPDRADHFAGGTGASCSSISVHLIWTYPCLLVIFRRLPRMRRCFCNCSRISLTEQPMLLHVHAILAGP